MKRTRVAHGVMIGLLMAISPKFRNGRHKVRPVLRRA